MAAALTLDIRPSIKCLTDLCIAYTKHLSRGVSRCLLCAQTATPPPVVDATGAAAISAASGALAAYAATVRSEKAARAMRDGDGVVSFPLPPPSPAAACPHLAPFSGLGPDPTTQLTSNHRTPLSVSNEKGTMTKIICTTSHLHRMRLYSRKQRLGADRSAHGWNCSLSFACSVHFSPSSLPPAMHLLMQSSTLCHV